MQWVLPEIQNLLPETVSSQTVGPPDSRPWGNECSTISQIDCPRLVENCPGSKGSRVQGFFTFVAWVLLPRRCHRIDFQCEFDCFWKKPWGQVQWQVGCEFDIIGDCCMCNAFETDKVVSRLLCSVGALPKSNSYQQIRHGRAVTNRYPN